MAIGLSTNALFCLYKSLVLPILEYGLPVWNLHTQKLQTTWRGYRGGHRVLSSNNGEWKCLTQIDCNFLIGPPLHLGGSSTYYFLSSQSHKIRKSPVILLAILFVSMFLSSFISRLTGRLHHTPTGPT